MAFKIWGKNDAIYSKSELCEKLKQLGITDSFSLINTLIEKGSVNIGQTKFLLLK